MGMSKQSSRDFRSAWRLLEGPLKGNRLDALQAAARARMWADADWRATCTAMRDQVRLRAPARGNLNTGAQTHARPVVLGFKIFSF
jgi:hypothetical protein